MNISSYLVSMRFAPILAQAAGGLAEGASKAMGIVMLNPLVIEKAPVDAEVMRLTRLKKQHAESLYQMRSRIRSLVGSVETCERDIANVREDLRARTQRGAARSVAFAAPTRIAFQDAPRTERPSPKTQDPSRLRADHPHHP